MLSLDKELYKLRNKVQHFELDESLEDALNIILCAIDEISNFYTSQILVYIENGQYYETFKYEFDRLYESRNELNKLCNITKCL